MLVKKFEAPSIQEALDTVKRELGPDAIILKTRRNRSRFGLLSKNSIEITAAVSEKQVKKMEVVEKRLNKESLEGIRKLPPKRQSRLYDEIMDKYLSREKIKDELKSGDYFKGRAIQRFIDIKDEPEKPNTFNLRSVLDRLQKKTISTVDIAAEVKKQSEIAKSKEERIQSGMNELKALYSNIKLNEEVKVLENSLPVQANAVESENVNTGKEKQDSKETDKISETYRMAQRHLVINGIESKFATPLVEDAFSRLKEKDNDDAMMDEVAHSLMNNVVVDRLITAGSASQSIICFVGPTGVGKTTTVAKLAGDILKKKLGKVGLINLDWQKAGAHEQIEAYSKIFNLPFRSVSSVDEFKDAIDDFSAIDYVLVDTAGYTHQDEEAINELNTILSNVNGVRRVLVVPATIRDQELYAVGKRFASMKPEGLVFSKLDESLTYGTIYNFSRVQKLPIYYFTTGQKVPDDLEEASKERLAALIMEF